MVTPTNNLYAPPKSAVADVAENDDAERATRGSRFGAKFIDGLCWTVPFIPSYLMAWPTILSGAKAGGGHPRMGIIGVWAMLAGTGIAFYIGALLVLCLMAVTAVLVHRNGQTIGKKCLGIKIVRTDGSRATLARIFWLRYLVTTLLSLIPALGSLYVLVDILFIFGRPERCIHDYIADTIVVKA
jgi:uncharacterized RDD family membrane protein YckC